MTNYPEIPKLEYPKAEPSEVSQKRPVRPWDIFNKNVEKVSNEIKDQRLSICLECPRLIKATKQCKECGCFMDVKAKLFDSTCPLDKWKAIEVNRDQFDYREG